MSNFRPPCLNGECPQSMNSSSTKRFCQAIGDLLMGAGGTGLLEITPCPIEATFTLGPEQEHPVAAEVRANLGIVDYFEDVDLA